jgi:hypothetical protein
VDDNGEIMRLPSLRHEEFLAVSRFQVVARLGSVYLVDQVSRALDASLEWQSKNQETLFGGCPANTNETIYGGTSDLQRYMEDDDENDEVDGNNDDDSEGDSDSDNDNEDEVKEKKFSYHPQFTDLEDI